MPQTDILVLTPSESLNHLIDCTLSGMTDFSVSVSMDDPKKARSLIKELNPSIVVFDLDLYGRENLELLLKVKSKDCSFIALSSASGKDSFDSIAACEMGVADFLVKPYKRDIEKNIESLTRGILEKTHAVMGYSGSGKLSSSKKTKILRRPEVILVGSSACGPRSLMEFLPLLETKTSLPIVVLQHAIASFTTPLAESLASRCQRPLREARKGDEVRSDHTYIAPGGIHLQFSRGPAGNVLLGLSDRPGEHGMRPSMDFFFRSAMPIYGAGALCFMLGANGTDGMKGVLNLRRVGAPVFGQSDLTDPEWIKARAVERTLSLKNMAAVAEMLSPKTSKRRVG